MLIELASHNDDIRRLLEKGYALRYDSEYLVVRNVPYLDAQKALQVVRGEIEAEFEGRAVGAALSFGAGEIGEHPLGEMPGQALGEANVATLELDQWSPRGLAGGSEGRPRTVHETLPDLYGARAYLAAHPRIDAARIGAMGFSFGGVACISSLICGRCALRPVFMSIGPHVCH